MPPPEALRLLRVSKRDLAMARRLVDPAVEEASWGWAMQQCIEKLLKACLSTLGLPLPRSPTSLASFSFLSRLEWR